MTHSLEQQMIIFQYALRSSERHVETITYMYDVQRDSINKKTLNKIISYNVMRNCTPNCFFLCGTTIYLVVYTLEIINKSTYPISKVNSRSST